MSFLPPSGTPFSFVTDNPSVDQLNAAINNAFQSGLAVNAPPGLTNQTPGQTVVVGGGNTTSVNTPPGLTGDILVTGAGTRLNLIGGGPANVQGTNLGGGGVIIETIQDPNQPVGTEPDLGTKVIDLSSRYSDQNITIDTTELVGGNLTYNPQQTIDDASGGLSNSINFVFYAHGGSGNDRLIGSGVSDFLRGGAGNDQINAGGGDDLVRGGAGSDIIELGGGMDAMFYTVDQIDGAVDVISDFSSADDTLYFDSPLINPSNVSIVEGGRAIEITLNDKTLRIVSNGDNFQSSDINFI